MTRRYRNLAPTAIAAALLLPLGAFAADAVPTADQSETPAAEAKATTPAARKTPPECESTSSRIHRKASGKCAPSAAPTRSYSKDELDSTGQTDVGEALKRLDPRFY